MCRRSLTPPERERHNADMKRFSHRRLVRTSSFSAGNELRRIAASPKSRAHWSRAVGRSLRRFTTGRGGKGLPRHTRRRMDGRVLVCTKQIASQDKDVPGALYPKLAASAFVGIVRLPQGMSDYRGQSIPAGTYTLRYELLPQDGNHMGVAPNPDFLLASPVADDSRPEQLYRSQEAGRSERQGDGHGPPRSDRAGNRRRASDRGEAGGWEPRLHS